jgi:hypothetical protein
MTIHAIARWWLLILSLITLPQKNSSNKIAGDKAAQFFAEYLTNKDADNFVFVIADREMTYKA